MPKFYSEGSVSFQGKSYPSVDGVVDVPSDAVSILLQHGLVMAPDVVEPAIEVEESSEKRRGRPPKFREGALA